MASIDELRAERVKKLQALKDKGINPYPSASKKTHTLTGILESFSSLESSQDEIVVDIICP